jgi:hypothetical protein
LTPGIRAASGGGVGDTRRTGCSTSSRSSKPGWTNLGRPSPLGCRAG